MTIDKSVMPVIKLHNCEVQEQMISLDLNVSLLYDISPYKDVKSPLSSKN
ncbi:hypothetical protein X777_14070 [Ooceraea biroi]|uniref:Uncharacterized protein n=1 Tax=Ooceraea biroi TaxID=2015173 RepID=A0A026VX90_OOCBI|nr:hypothetical protein X777_14070 [Ooceraea biroi]